MFRHCILLFCLLITQKLLAQNEAGGFTRADYDTLISIHAEMEKKPGLHRDSAYVVILLKHLQRAKEWAEKMGAEKERARCALVEWDYLSWARSRDIYRRIVVGEEVRAYRDHLPQNEQLKVLGHLSSFYQRTKRPIERLEVAIEICALQKKIDSQTHCGELSGIYHDLKQYEQAIKHYRNDILNAKLEGNWVTVASVHNNIGLAYRDMNLRDSAEFYFRSSLEMLADKSLMLEVITESYLEHFTNVVKWNLAHHLDDRITSEKVQLAKSLAFSGAQVPEYIWVLKAYDLLAKYSYQSSAFETAKQYADSALVLAKDSKHMDTWVQLLRLKGKILLAEGSLEQAENYFRQSEELDDSVRVAEAALDASIATAKFEAKEREEELKASKEETREKAREAEKEHRQKLWLIGLFTASLIFLALVVFLFGQSLKNRRTITRQNRKLEATLAEKEVLLKEIHHRVKNNLQVISSLLDLQSNRLMDEVSQKAFLEGQNRVRSIALIHQQLYQNEDSTGIEIMEFCKSLFEQIRTAMMKKGQQIELRLKGEKAVFDIDTAVPLGLILNEMLTNSFKHAFRESQANLVVIEWEKVGEGKFELRYRDGGPGLPEDIDLKKVRSLGLRLIYRLSRQLGGSAKVNQPGGYLFIVEFLETDMRKVID